MSMKPKHDLSQAIRAAFEASGMSILQLSKRSGVQYSSAHGFVRGTVDIQLSTATKLCTALGLELRPVKRSSKAKG